MGTFDYTYAERQRDMDAEHYQKFFIKDPIDTIDFTVGAETADVINVALQVVDPHGDPIEQVMALDCYVCSDAEGKIPAVITDVTVAVGTDGTILKINTANRDFMLLTDEEGKADLDFTDSGDGAETGYLAVKLPDGNFVVSSALTWGIQYDAAYVIGAEIAEAKNVGIQVKDGNGDNIAAVVPLLCFVCSDPAGANVVAMTGVAVTIGATGVLGTVRIPNADFTVTTNSSGHADLVFTDSLNTAKTGYLAIELPDEAYKVSGAITFAIT